MEVSRGTIYLRGNTWTIGYTVGGRRVREAIGSNRQMAEIVLKKRIIESLENRHLNVRNLGRIPFSEFADTYMDRCISVLKSAKTERIRVLYWKRFFGNRPIGQITAAELQDWQARKRQSCRPASVNRMMSRLRHLINRAVDWDVLAESPMRKLKFLRENNARLRFLTLAECDRLIGACIAPHMRALVIVALHTGMRLGEILDLKWADLDFASGMLTVRDSKNGTSRVIPLDLTLVELLSKWPRMAGSDSVFPNAKGNRWTYTNKAFRNARTRAGLADLHFHDLRHTFASHWVMNSGNLMVLRDILGHKNITMTQRYAHLSPAYKQAIFNSMNSMWKAAPVAANTPVSKPATPRRRRPATRMASAPAQMQSSRR